MQTRANARGPVSPKLTKSLFQDDDSSYWDSSSSNSSSGSGSDDDNDRERPRRDHDKENRVDDELVPASLARQRQPKDVEWIDENETKDRDDET
ncbi:hypothetical protein P43SY_003373 [Pythium insidiosum]|uniref:Uncharacterized protein n=1 Tax=Pythium insidiosum TaxID=114742 RepID=A0AAD5M9F6_PYTIN|nr:hypothetical protein P43SY_003373 [Pythium insidiosum]